MSNEYILDLSLPQAAEELGVDERRLYQFVMRNKRELTDRGAYKPEPVWIFPSEAVAWVRENYGPAKRRRGV